jgi:hypothetical protein
LITRKSEYFKSAILKLPIESLQAKVLASKATATSNIDDQQNFARVVIHLFDVTI